MIEQTLKAVDVFTPNDYPILTYVERKQNFERTVRNGFETPNIIVSVSGPSKSGKSVLLQKVIGRDNLIRIFGPQVTVADGVWHAVLDWMGTPAGSSSQTASGKTLSSTISGQGSLGLPGIASVGAQTNIVDGSSNLLTEGQTFARVGLKQVEREIARSAYVVFIDDFHYMARPLQVEIAKQLKAAAELGIKICVAIVPHRADDIVRANAELRGRVLSIDMDYWGNDELQKIASEGFPQLNVDVGQDFIARLAVEACGSPQLMQALCLQTCNRFDISEKRFSMQRLVIDKLNVKQILEATAAMTDFSTIVEAMHVGPKSRGQDRNQYPFRDGTTGDVYRAVLKAIAADPPVMSFTYNEVLNRVHNVCVDENRVPVGSSISEACSQIDKIARKSVEKETGVQGLAPVEWDTNADVENLHVTEPYFLFYLRSSSKLQNLGKLTKNIGHQ